MSSVVSAIGILVNLTTAAVEIAANAQTVASLIQKAQMQGRDTFTEEEWKQIQGLDDAARKRLEDAIARQKSPPTPL
jgi:uncharacterized protein YydD (DUF2326 family)